MKNIFLFIFIIVLAIAGMIFAQEQSHVDFAYGEWTITLKAWLLVLGLIVLMLTYKIIAGSICWLVNLPKHFCNYRNTKRDVHKQENQQAYEHGLVNINNTKDLTELNEQWNMISQHLRKDPVLAAAYVNKAIHYGGETAAASIIEWQLSREWQPVFVNYYGLLKKNTAARLKEAEYWLKTHVADVTLLVTAARLAITAEEWGKAEQYLQQSITLEPTVAAYLELALVQQQLGKTELTWQSYQTARQLQRAIGSV